MQISYDEIKEILEYRLTEKRYYHSLCVADEAKRLALKYGADPEKAYLSGLVHDITKNSTEEEHLNIFNKFGIILNNVEKNSEKLWHAISGSAYVENVLKIDDSDVINAVRYHTTAKENMTLLERILYLADFTSKDRNYDDVDVMRKLVDESLDKAMVYSLSYTIRELVEKGVAIHFDTLLAYNEYVSKGVNK